MNGIYCTNTRSDVANASPYGHPQRKANNQSFSEQSRPCPNETCNKIMTLNDNYCNKCGTCVNKKYSHYGKMNPVTAAHLKRQEESTQPVQHTIRRKRSYPAPILSRASTPVPCGAYYPPTSAVTTVAHTPEVGSRESVSYEENWSQWHNTIDKPMQQQASQPVLTEDQYTEEHYQQIYKELKELTSASDQSPAQESSYFGFNMATFEMPSLYNSVSTMFSRKSSKRDSILAF